MAPGTRVTAFCRAPCLGIRAVARQSERVSEEPEGVGVNPANGEVYVTCEEKGEVYAISPDEKRVLATIEVGGRPHSICISA